MEEPAEQGAQRSDVGGGGRGGRAELGVGSRTGGREERVSRGGQGEEGQRLLPSVLASLLQTLMVEAAAKAQGGAACQPRLFSLSDK